MARVLSPLMSIDASGSVGGVQFSKNRYGNFGSRKSTSTPASGDGVLTYRSQLARAHHMFDSLTAAQKATWNLTPDTHVNPREHFLKLYLARAARGLTTGTTYPGDRETGGFAWLSSLRNPYPSPIISFSWLTAFPATAWVDVTAHCTPLCSFDGHPRKFKWQAIYPHSAEEVSFLLSPNARYATVHISIVDYYTLRIYYRWVYHWDDNVQISVTPPQPQD